jgi:hypothetical protein
MPIEKREPTSKARLFIPTQREQALVKTQRHLNDSVDEVNALKEELQKLISDAKGK